MLPTRMAVMTGRTAVTVAEPTRAHESVTLSVAADTWSSARAIGIWTLAVATWAWTRALSVSGPAVRVQSAPEIPLGPSTQSFAQMTYVPGGRASVVTVVALSSRGTAVFGRVEYAFVGPTGPWAPGSPFTPCAPRGPRFENESRRSCFEHFARPRSSRSSPPFFS